jgi:lipopolysaccharide transport system ATP-binding protein
MSEPEAGRPAVVLTDVAKRFKLYRDRRTNLKEVFTARRRRNRYDEFWAVDGVSLQIPRGTTYALVGHNGSGKSTLLKLIAGIHRPNRGTIEVNGRVSAMLELGAGFHPELSGRENIYLNGAILGMTKRQIAAAVDSIIEFSGLAEFIDTPVKVYSSGMYVRLGFSIAVTLDPEILVIDEIVAVGDEEFQRRCFDHLAELRRRGVTIILVTHALQLVQQLADRAAWLDRGRLKAEGDPLEVVDAYVATVNEAESERLGVELKAENDALRRGSGDVQVSRVEFVDAAGRAGRVGVTGQPLTVRIHFDVRTPVDDAVFGVGFHNEHGIHLAGPNSQRSGLRVGRLDHAGYVDYVLDRFPFAPGRYEVSAAVVDRTLLHVYDYRDRAFDLHVQPGGGGEVVGVTVLDGRWRLPTAEREESA